MKVLDQVSAILKQKGGQVWTVSAAATVFEALGIMANREIGALLVVDGEKLLGVLSGARLRAQDYLAGALFEGDESVGGNGLSSYYD